MLINIFPRLSLNPNRESPRSAKFFSSHHRFLLLIVFLVYVGLSFQCYLICIMRPRQWLRSCKELDSKTAIEQCLSLAECCQYELYSRFQSRVRNSITVLRRFSLQVRNRVRGKKKMTQWQQKSTSWSQIMPIHDHSHIS